MKKCSTLPFLFSIFFGNTFLSCAEPTPTSSLKRRDLLETNLQNQLPLLPFNSNNGPMNWLLPGLTHILSATIFMQPIQKLPSSNRYVNHTADSPHYTLTNGLKISLGENVILANLESYRKNITFHITFIVIFSAHLPPSWTVWAEPAH